MFNQHTTQRSAKYALMGWLDHATALFAVATPAPHRQSVRWTVPRRTATAHSTTHQCFTSGHLKPFKHTLTTDETYQEKKKPRCKEVFTLMHLGS